MNVSIFVVMNNHNAKWIVDNYNILFKQLFKIGLNITQFAVVEDLLGLDYKSFSKGLTIFVEDEEKKASELLVSLNQMADCGNGTYSSPSNNIMVINTNTLNSFDLLKNVVVTNLKLDYDNYCIKCFGLSEENINNYLKEYKISNNIFDYYVHTEYGDSLIIFRFLSSVDKNIQDNIVSVFVKDLKKAFYASKDIGLAEAVVEILSLRNLKISIAENFTGGKLTDTLLNETDSAYQFIDDALIVYSAQSLQNQLHIDKKILDQYSEVSAEVVYEMATNMLDHSSCDIVIATSGYTNSNNTGVFFTAIGDRDAVNVYKHSVLGDKNFVIKYGTNTTIFELIKKLRQNTLNISNYAV